MISGLFLAQSGDLDTTFNVADSGNGYGDGANGNISQSIKLSDGKILLVGNFTTYNGSTANRIVRINPNGTIDNTFSSGTGFDAYVYSADVQSDGKILVGGNFTKYNNTTVYRLARLNADGTLDSTFTGSGTGPNNIVSGLTILPSGKIIIYGSFTLYNDDYTAIKIARLNSDGSFDSSFKADPGAGISNSGINKVLYDATNNNYIVGGSFTGFNGATGVSIKNLVKLDDSGNVITSFNTGTGFNSTVSMIEMQSDGKFLVGGAFTSYNGTTVQNLVRLNTDGTLDSSFNNSNTTTGGVYTLKIVGTDIYVGGNFTTFSGASVNRFAKLSANGVLDSTFNNGQAGASGSVLNIIPNTDGSFYLLGSFATYNDFVNQYFTHINNDGSVDSSYNLSTGADSTVNAITVQPDKKIIVAGNMSTFNGIPTGRLTRLNNDGSLDSTFITGTGANGTLNSIALQSDEKILVGGTFTKYNGTSVTNLIRVDKDGMLDTGFSTTGTGFNNGIMALAVQNDGKILAGGNFTAYGSTSINRFVRLNENGTIDNSFAIGTGANSGSVAAVTVQQDGKILLAGSFTSFNGKTAKVIRLNTDGSLDTSFTGGAANFLVNTIALQPDGKIIIGGNFTTINGITSTRVARLNADGTTDTSFIASPTASIVDAAVLSLALQADGKIILGGSFTKYNSTSSNRLMRLNADGSLDTNFSVGSVGANNTINIVTLDSDGKALIGGLFTNYKGLGKNRIARILTSDSTLSVMDEGKNSTMLYPNPFIDSLYLNSQKDIKTVQIFDVSGKLLQQSNKKVLELSNLSAGVYFISIMTADNKVEMKKVIKK